MPPITSTLNQPLSQPLRTQLENTVKAARDVAEKAGLAALTQLAVAGLVVHSLGLLPWPTLERVAAVLRDGAGDIAAVPSAAPLARRR